MVRRDRPSLVRAAVAGVAPLLLVATACTVSSAAPGTTASPTAPVSAGSGPTPTPSASPAVELTPSVAADASVPVDTVVSVTAKNGTVSAVEMSYTDEKGARASVAGTIAPDNSSWTANALLEPGTAYTLQMSGQNADGVTNSSTSTFTTQKLSKKQQIFPAISGDGMTVGVAMPVVVTFDVPVADRAAFEKKMTVTSAPAQEGSWSWISNREIHWRPKEYWQPGTKVDVNVDINGVAGGNGTYGQVSKKASFTVGGSTVIKADLATKQMTVTVDGAVVRTVPVTGGKPGWETRSGHKVIMEKFPLIKMDAATMGVPKDSPEYYSLDVRYAMRETWSGEFLHAAPWSAGSHGRSNVSHGCIGMGTANAQWLFNLAKVGDPVVVTGTKRGMEKGNGWTDWNYSFDEFKKGSALAG